MCAIDVFYDPPFSLIHNLLALAICNKMFVNPMKDESLLFWDWLEFMHNIIDSSTTINDTKGGTWHNLHLSKETDGDSAIWPTTRICVHSQHQKIALWEPNCTKFSWLVCTQPKWPKQRTFLKLSPIFFFWYWLWSPCTKHGIVLFIHALHFAKSYVVGSIGGNSNKTFPSKVIGKNWTFWKGILS